MIFGAFGGSGASIECQQIAHRKRVLRMTWKLVAVGVESRKTLPSISTSESVPPSASPNSSIEFDIFIAIGNIIIFYASLSPNSAYLGRSGCRVLARGEGAERRLRGPSMTWPPPRVSWRESSSLALMTSRNLLGGALTVNFRLWR